MNTLRFQLAEFVATGFGTGKAPHAPGTFGSLPGLALAALCHLVAGRIDRISNGMIAPWVTCLVLIALVGLAGWWSIMVREQHRAVHDEPSTVIDEVVGMALTLAFVPLTWVNCLAGFAIFRLIDITKPPPVCTIDRRMHSAAGTLLDDVAAGAMGALLLWALNHLW